MKNPYCQCIGHGNRHDCGDTECSEAQKVLGCFGGYGFGGGMGVHPVDSIPALFDLLAIAAGNSRGSLALVAGLLTRAWASIRDSFW